MCAIEDRSESIYSYISKADAVRKSLKPSLTSKSGVFDAPKSPLFNKAGKVKNYNDRFRK